MKLIDLPITLREAAVKNQIAQGNERDVYRLLAVTCLGGNFDWHDAPEDGEFWSYAYDGQFSQTLKYLL